MFKSAVFKLTAWYMGALVLVCLIFSVPIYSFTASRLRNGAVRQTEFFRQLPPPFEGNNYVQRLVSLRDKQLANDRHELLLSLILINAGIVGIGAYASYLFARRTLKPLEKAHAAQVRFTEDASHELRTPLAIMQTEIEVALRNKQLDKKDAKSVLESNLEEVARLRQLSDQLLSLTRADAESVSLVALNLAKLVQDQAQSLAKQYKIPIPVTTPKNIIVLADKLLLPQVLGIIVENAVTYSGNSDPKITIDISIIDNNAHIQIKNQGDVISSKDLTHIFDRFYRGSRATIHNSKGHGLGLSLAKDIISRHKGMIAATSSKTNGTVFTIQLPIAQ